MAFFDCLRSVAVESLISHYDLVNAIQNDELQRKWMELMSILKYTDFKVIIDGDILSEALVDYVSDMYPSIMFYIVYDNATDEDYDYVSSIVNATIVTGGDNDSDAHEVIFIDGNKSEMINKIVEIDQEFGLLSCIWANQTELDIDDVSVFDLVHYYDGYLERFAETRDIFSFDLEDFSLQLHPHIDCCVVGLQGHRESMEDTHIANSFTMNGERIEMFGVFDGHGGTETSIIIADHIVNYFANNLKKFTKSNAKRVFMDFADEVDSMGWTELKSSGSTAVVFLRRGSDGIFINLGDSRGMVIDEDGEIVFVTEDHTPDSEKKRIESQGGMVTGGYISAPNTNWMLAVSRAIGDLHFKDTGILITEPDVTKVKIPVNGRLLLSCDGLFEPWNINNKTVAKWAMKMSCHEIAMTAIDRGSTDNVSVMIHEM